MYLIVAITLVCTSLYCLLYFSHQLCSFVACFCSFLLPLGKHMHYLYIFSAVIRMVYQSSLVKCAYNFMHLFGYCVSSVELTWSKAMSMRPHNLIPRSHNAHEWQERVWGHWCLFLDVQAQHSCDYLYGIKDLYWEIETSEWPIGL